MQIETEVGYDSISLKQCTPQVATAITTHSLGSKNKSRRYWTEPEECIFYKIWGRDNWRLTKHGKNTLTFAKWANELREQFDIDIKPEEIQTKVNQTRAKFRRVQKQMLKDANCRQWKKYDIVEKILRNEYRPTDAEPVPPEALENNRDLPLLETNKPPSPPKYNTNSHINDHDQNGALGVVLGIDENIINDDFNDNIYNGEYEVKTEHQYSFQYPPQQDFTTINENANAQRKFEHSNIISQINNEQNIAQINKDMEENVNSIQRVPLQHPEELLERHIQQLQQEQTREMQTSELYTDCITPTITENSNVPSHIDLKRNEQHNLIPKPADKVLNKRKMNDGFDNYSNIMTNQTEINNDNCDEIPGPSASSKKRSITTNCSAIATDISMDQLYLEEIRKKNNILEERKEISRKLLEIEERKVVLIERFIPKFLEMQNKIWDKLNNS